MHCGPITTEPRRGDPDGGLVIHTEGGVHEVVTDVVRQELRQAAISWTSVPAPGPCCCALSTRRSAAIALDKDTDQRTPDRAPFQVLDVGLGLRGSA